MHADHRPQKSAYVPSALPDLSFDMGSLSYAEALLRDKDLHVISQLGSGGQATVFHVVTKSGRDHAVKVFNPAADESVGPAAELLAFKALKDVDGIVRAPRVYTGMDGVCIVMERAMCSLYDLMIAGGPLSLKQQLAYSKGILKTLSSLHREGWRHNDVKPENLLIMRSGKLKLGDLGFAAPLTDMHVVYAWCGTRGFIAPEDLAKPYGSRGKSPAGDAYAAGATILELVVPEARNADHREILNRAKGKLPQPLRDVVCGLMAACPERRLTVQAALELLRQPRRRFVPCCRCHRNRA